jgi:hypothetical protein
MSFIKKKNAYILNKYIYIYIYIYIKKKVICSKEIKKCKEIQYLLMKKCTKKKVMYSKEIKI